VEVEATRIIDIDKLVPAEEIDRRYYDKPYYIAPSGKEGAEAFNVIRDAMEAKDMIALARVVMANREHIIALEPFDKGFLGSATIHQKNTSSVDKAVAGPQSWAGAYVYYASMSEWSISPRTTRT
jgi:non-homologous end joining protein Ku